MAADEESNGRHRDKNRRESLQALERTCEEDEENDETFLDAALRAIPSLHHHKSSNDDSLEASSSSSPLTSTTLSQKRPPLERRRNSMALARILESLSTVDDALDESDRLRRGGVSFANKSRLSHSTSGFPNNSDSNSTHHEQQQDSSRRIHTVDSIYQSDQDLLMSPEVRSFLQRVIQEEFPKEVHPNLRDLIHIGKSRGRQCLYKPGDWVEIQGGDMKWKLEMITRVVKQAPPDWDWNDPANADRDPQWEYFFHAGRKRMLPPQELRSPKEGLLRLFGTRPFLWQQWVCLKLEQTLRFQKGHQNDFEWKDIQKFAFDYWERWLIHPKNSDFYNHFHSNLIGDFGRQQLVDHIMRPFHLMEQIKHDKERWNFHDDDSISVYSYLSIFGTTFFLPLVIILLQFFIPTLLFLHLDTKEESGSRGGELCKGFDNLVWYGTVGEECEISRVAQGMAIVVLSYYMCKIVPDSFASFYNVLGDADTAYSKLQSMRHQIWKRHDDRFGQVVGYQMDIYMNTAYVCVLYMLNILVIINTNDAFEIILNALAFEWVIRLDHEFSKSRWWDSDKRWIRAGALELVLQRTILKRTLSCSRLFSDEFNVDEKILNGIEHPEDSSVVTKNGQRCRKTGGQLLKDKALAAEDAENEDFMTNAEKVNFQCRKISIELENKHAIDEYEKHPVDFGVIRSFIRFVSGRRGGGLFNRHAAFRTWSRWEKLLFLPPIPNLDEILDADSSGNAHVKRELKDIVPTSHLRFANFSERNHNTSEWEMFRTNYVNVVTLKSTCSTIKAVSKEKDLSWRRSIVTVLLDGPAKWLAFVIQGVFPFYNIVCLIAVVVATTRGEVP